MNVKVEWRTANTPKGKVHVSNEMTIKEANQFYKTQLKDIAIEAYMTRFDGWYTRKKKVFKEKPAQETKKSCAGEGQR